MFKPKIKDYGLDFDRELTERDTTDMVVIHHTGNPTDDDLSAEDIHELHLNNGWAGIGYHFVVRKDGTIEEGRPMDTMGAHAEGENYHTIGIHFSGNFEDADPTKEQIENGAILIAWLCDYYGIDCNGDNVVGHRDLMATACPGENLYDKLPDIIGKAIWYSQNYDDAGNYLG